MTHISPYISAITPAPYEPPVLTRVTPSGVSTESFVSCASHPLELSERERRRQEGGRGRGRAANIIPEEDLDTDSAKCPDCGGDLPPSDDQSYVAVCLCGWNSRHGASRQLRLPNYGTLVLPTGGPSSRDPGAQAPGSSRRSGAASRSILSVRGIHGRPYGPILMPEEEEGSSGCLYFCQQLRVRENRKFLVMVIIVTLVCLSGFALILYGLIVRSARALFWIGFAVVAGTLFMDCFLYQHVTNSDINNYEPLIT